MNVKRGLFRVWIIASAGWGVLLLTVYWEAMTAPYLPPQVYLILRDKPGIWEIDDPYSFPTPSDSRLLAYRNNVRLYIDNAANPSTVSASLADFVATYVDSRDDIANSIRTVAIRWYVLSVAVPAFLVLALGWAVVWALSGFASTKQGDS